MDQSAIPDATCVSFPIQGRFEPPNDGYIATHKSPEVSHGRTHIMYFMCLEFTFEVGSFNVKRTLPSGRGGGRRECATVHKSISVATMHSGRQSFGKHIGVIVGSRAILDHDATFGNQFT